MDEVSQGQNVPLDRTRAAATDLRGRSLESIILAHFTSVWRFLRRLGVPAADADDAMQEVVLVAARKLDSITPGSERSFLLGTAFRVARRHRSTLARRQESSDETLVDLEDTARGPESLLSRGEERAILDDLLQQMPVDLRAVFVLFELEEQSTLDIARELDIPAGTVASRLRRAREDWAMRVARLEARTRREGSEL
jgi:RNA polymerase sigma-70 factor (ECF subfamily)